MKKFLILGLTLIMALNLCGCKKSKTDIIIDGDEVFDISSQNTSSYDTFVISSSEPEVLWQSVRGDDKDRDLKTFYNKTNIHFVSFGVRPSGYTNFLQKEIELKIDDYAAFEFTGPDLSKYKTWDLRFEDYYRQVYIAKNVRINETGNFVIYYENKTLCVKDDNGNALN